MDKEYIKNTIDDSIVVEEMAIPIYKQELENELFWSNFTPDDEAFIKESLQKLTTESEKHIAILSALKSKLGE